MLLTKYFIARELEKNNVRNVRINTIHYTFKHVFKPDYK